MLILIFLSQETYLLLQHKGFFSITQECTFINYEWNAKKMDFEQKAVIFRSSVLIFSGIFGLIFYIFVIFNWFSIIFSVFFLVFGLTFTYLSIAGKSLEKMSHSPEATLAFIIILLILGSLFTVLCLNKFYFADFPVLLFAITCWGLLCHFIWYFIHKKRKRLS